MANGQDQALQTPAIPEEVVDKEQQEIAASQIQPEVTEAEAIDQEVARVQEQGLTPQERFDAKRAELQETINSGAIPGLEGKTIPPSQVFAALDEEDAQQAQAQAEEENNLNQRLQERKLAVEEAAKRGITLEEDPELDPLLQQATQAEEATAAQAAKDAEIAAQGQKEAEKEIDTAKKEIVREQAVRQGTADLLRQDFARQQQETQKILGDIQAEDIELSKIGEESFFERQNTFGQIATGIALALGSISAAGRSKRGSEALDTIMQAVDRDIKTQKLNQDAQLARKKHGLEIAKLRLGEVARKSGNSIAIANAEEFDRKLSLEQEKIDQERANLKALQSGGPIDPSMLSKDDRERSVRMPDGTIRLADNKEAAKDLTKFKNEVEPAKSAAERVLQLSKEGSRFSLEDRARIATEMQGIIGNLRLSFLGPGAMTEAEYDRLKDTLGNPNAFFALPEIERVKLQTVVKKLNTDLDTRYKNAGVPRPKSKRAKLIDRMRRQNPGASNKNIESNIDKLISAGKLSSEFGN